MSESIIPAVWPGPQKLSLGIGLRLKSRVSTFRDFVESPAPSLLQSTNHRQSMKARQAVVVEPFRVEIRDADIPDPAANQVSGRVRGQCDQRRHGVGRLHRHAPMAQGSEHARLEVSLPARLQRRRPVVCGGLGDRRVGSRAIASAIRATMPARIADHRSRTRPAVEDARTAGRSRRRLWRLHLPLWPRRRPAGRASRWAGRRRCWAQGIIGQFALRCLLAAGCHPVVGIDSVPMRREGRAGRGRRPRHRSHRPGDANQQLRSLPRRASGAEIVVDATGVPDAVPVAMSLACDAGQVVVVGSPRGKAKDVNFYDDLHRRYIEVTGAHGNMLFEPAHTRLAGAWDINKAQRWLLAALASGRLSTGRTRHAPHRARRTSARPTKDCSRTRTSTSASW